MQREFIEDGMGFKTLQKESTDQGGDQKGTSMNLREYVKPTYGSIVQHGEEINKGPDYLLKQPSRLTRQ